MASSHVAIFIAVLSCVMVQVPAAEWKILQNLFEQAHSMWNSEETENSSDTAYDSGESPIPTKGVANINSLKEKEPKKSEREHSNLFSVNTTAKGSRPTINANDTDLPKPSDTDKESGISFFREKLSWDGARNVCKAYDLDLISLEDQAQIEYVTRLLKGQKFDRHQGRNYWLGAKGHQFGLGSHYDWFWVNSEPHRQVTDSSKGIYIIPPISSCLSGHYRNKDASKSTPTLELLFGSNDCSDSLPFICGPKQPIGKESSIQAAEVLTGE